MGTKFKSQICTSREQSERLLALGLKNETADMFIWIDNRISEVRNTSYIPQDYFLEYYREHLIRDGSVFIPAWSLHRLWELDNINYIRLDNKEEIAKLYDCIIDNIEAQIKEGNFNKEYLD